MQPPRRATSRHRSTLALAAVCIAVASIASGCLDAAESPDFRTPGRAPSKVLVEGGRLTVDQSTFLVKGVVYSPIPPGVDPAGKDKSWDVIYHPEIYERDFPLLKELGANAIRIVHASGDVAPTWAMLDEADRFGLKVILGLPGPVGKDSGDASVREATLREARQLVLAYRDHPAVLMWLYGNEVNYKYAGSDVRDWYTLLDEMAKAAHSLDPNHPVVTANNALANVDLVRTLAPHVDVYGTNQYAPDPREYSDFLAPGVKAKLPGMPLLVTEFGSDAWDSNAASEYEDAQAQILVNDWRTLAGLSAPAGPVIGGCVFEFSDEWWKGGNANAPDGRATWTPGHAAALPDGKFSEAYFGLVRTTLKGVEPRKAYYALGAMWASPDDPIPPTISQLGAAKVGDLLRVSASVYTHGGVPADVTLHYRVNADRWTETPMRLAGGNSYEATLGPFGAAAVLYYRVSARDEAGRTAASDESTARELPSLDAVATALALASAATLLAAWRRGQR